MDPSVTLSAAVTTRLKLGTAILPGQMADEAGRGPASLSVTVGGAPEDLAVLRRNRDLGVNRITVRLPPAGKDEILPILDRWAKLIPQVNN
jgi:hypothetical protein